MDDGDIGVLREETHAVKVDLQVPTVSQPPYPSIPGVRHRSVLGGRLRADRSDRTGAEPGERDRGAATENGLLERRGGEGETNPEQVTGPRRSLAGEHGGSPCPWPPPQCLVAADPCQK